MSGVKTSVVILNWNGLPMLKRFLPSVIACSGDAEIVVADNASTDGSVEAVRTLFSGVRIVTLDRNYGFADGYNRALKQVEAQYYVLLNSDVEVVPGWIEPLVGFLDNHADYCACQPKLRSYGARDMFEYAGASGGYIDKYGYPFCRGRLFSTVEGDHGQYDDVADVLWATGACLVIRSADYWRAGGLDARFFAHNEEIDLCWRLRLMGRRVACVPQSTVWHVGGGTLPKSNPMKTYLNFRNNLTMLYKNLPDSELHTVMRVRWVLDRVAALQMLLTGHWGECRAVLRARRDFMRWRHDFDDDRRRIQAARVYGRADADGTNACAKNDIHAEANACIEADKHKNVGEDIPGIYPRSVLADYYLRGRRLFSSLQW